MNPQVFVILNHAMIVESLERLAGMTRTWTMSWSALKFRFQMLG